jgi:hypothetical protein
MFDFIIDSGICKNIIGKHISKTIKLQLEANLKPYKIIWIKSVGDIRVAHVYKVFPLKNIEMRCIVI